MSRPRLTQLRDSGFRVRVIEVCDSVKDDHWVYCGEAVTLFCPRHVAFDAQDLWPDADLRETVGARAYLPMVGRA